MLKKILCIIGILTILTVGSMGVLADPYAVPGTQTNSVVVPPEIIE